MDLTSTDAARRYDALVRHAASSVVAVDFDGTLAPIVDDPAAAAIHPDAPAALVELSRRVRAIAVVTGRPARQVIELGGLEALGDAMAGHGCELHLFGQYGNERWSASTREVAGPPPPAGLAGFERELPDLLRRLDAADAHVEDKGLAVAVHTRRLDDPEAAFDRLLPGLRDLAQRHDLVVEPGRSVIEVRAPGVHKGHAVRSLVEETSAQGILFAGDDLGDLEAFDAVDDLAADLDTLLVACSSGEESALVDRADVVVAGPDGMVELFVRLATDAARAAAPSAR